METSIPDEVWFVKSLLLLCGTKFTKEWSQSIFFISKIMYREEREERGDGGRKGK
jgi:hypothetical protein